MTEMMQMIERYSLSYQKKMEELLQPAKDLFNVSGFWFSHTTPEGNFYGFGSGSKHIEEYNAQKHYLINPYYRAPSFFKGGVGSFKQTENREMIESNKYLAEETAIDHVLYVIQKDSGHLFHYAYGCKPKDSVRTYQNVINNLPLLKKFNAYLFSETKELRKRMARDCVHLPLVMGDLYHTPPTEELEEHSQQNKLRFLKQIGVLNVSLTKQELRCFKYIALGMTAAEIAKQLALSPRTVESYLINLKNKFNINRKSELTGIAVMLSEAGCI